MHIAGEGATQRVHIGQADLALGGMPDYYIQTIFKYSTLEEACKVAPLAAWKRLSL